MTIKTGRVSLALDGNVLMSLPGASLQIGDPEVTVEVSDQGDLVETERLRPSVIRATLPHVTELDITQLRRWRGTATFVTDNGHVFTVSPAAKTTLGELAEGNVDIEIQGLEAERS
ncbi:MAG: phage tail tube protein [Myxococcota bacterium]